ncbi:GNAT family N-acetyltransferase [Pseudanabaena galeata UHCC 0370]|uniref:GNAT family N-acetyltransferase n=1 Tax=Pseudanabaena galeata UHCC 0370 TaxID=3110310 RepID=A0ABU5TH64_9CYAN|nr:GNAT family N-acetyltransferase [Pseudanabaena galeata]MEA5477555.1 GNAT family N-acetyltransferase [Pseudanabaena galeata UHCC 0370]
MKFHRIEVAERSIFQGGIEAIEQTAFYPLGNDSFQIDHGDNYFAFFDRLGDVSYFAALDGERVAAVGAGILREVPDCQGEPLRLAWYLCDLKVHPDYQRQHLSMRLLHYALQSCVSKCDRGYTISMNASDGKPNRLVRIYEKFNLLRFRCSSILGIYSVDVVVMRSLEPILMKYRGKISYLSLQGIKDLKLQSNGQMLPLLHLQWGENMPIGIETPLTGYSHMFCVPNGDELAIALQSKGISPNATASLVSHGMDQSDWRFILTSDI